MPNKKMFAIDPDTEEVIVSESPEGSDAIHCIERIARKDHEVLYHAVLTLTGMARAAHVDVALFKAMDSICQSLYGKHRKG